MIYFFIMCLIGLCAALYLIVKCSDVIKEHKEEISKNRACIQLLNQRYAELASMVALCPDDFNTNDFFEEVEHNEQ